MEKIQKKSYQRESSVLEKIRIHQKFTGIIPNNIREKIAELIDNGIIKDWFIVAEAHEWSVDEETMIIPNSATDPLVVGITNASNPAILIDHFDLAPIEDMVRREFTS